MHPDMLKLSVCDMHFESADTPCVESPFTQIKAKEKPSPFPIVAQLSMDCDLYGSMSLLNHQ